MKYPNTTFAAQKVSICTRYIELFREEHNTHPLGLEARTRRFELDALIPELYHGHRLIWLSTKWYDVVNGNESLGFPGLPLNIHLAATSRKNEALQAWRAFAKWQREEHGAIISMLMYERHKAMVECRQDESHNPSISDFSTANGKKRLNVPSQKTTNESTNIAFAMRAFEIIPDMDNEHREAVFEALSAAKHSATKSTFWDSEIDKELVRTNIKMTEPPDPLEDYTTWTDIDPNSDFTITTNKIIVNTMNGETDSFVYKAGSWDGNFIHDFDVKVTAYGIISSQCSIWTLANVVDDYVWIRNNSEDMLGLIASDLHLRLYETVAGVSQFDEGSSLLVGTNYYFSGERDETVGTYGTLYARKYSDVDRTSLLETLSATLREKEDFQYTYAIQSQNVAPSRSISLEHENFDLHEEATGVGTLINGGLINTGLTRGRLIS